MTLAFQVPFDTDAGAGVSGPKRTGRARVIVFRVRIMTQAAKIANNDTASLR